MKSVELRKMSADEMEGKLSDTRDEYMKLRFQQVTGQLTDTSRLRQLRRVATLSTSKTIAAEPLLLLVPQSSSEYFQVSGRCQC